MGRSSSQAKIRAPEDLRGKRIGVQSIGGGVWMFTMLAFENRGLNPERDKIQFRSLAISRCMAQAMTQGTSSTALIWVTRCGTQMERQGYRILADLATDRRAVSGTWGDGEAESRSSATPEVAERALRAMVETIGYHQQS